MGAETPFFCLCRLSFCVFFDARCFKNSSACKSIWEDEFCDLRLHYSKVAKLFQVAFDSGWGAVKKVCNLVVLHCTWFVTVFPFGNFGENEDCYVVDFDYAFFGFVFANERKIFGWYFQECVHDKSPFVFVFLQQHFEISYVNRLANR